MSPHDLGDDDRVAIVSNMGAPLIAGAPRRQPQHRPRGADPGEYSGEKFRA